MGAVARIGAGVVLAVALGRATAGCGASAFACESDESCAGLPEGACEADGRCSVPDGDCDSGRRYASHSGPLSDRCVGGDSDGSDTGSTSAGATSWGSGILEGDGSTSTPSPVTTDADSSGGIEPVMPCDGGALIDESFDSAQLDQDVWNVKDDSGVWFQVIDGELRFMASGAEDDYTHIETVIDLPPAGRAGAELLAIAERDVQGLAYLVIEDLGTAYGFHVGDGLLEAFYDDGFDHLAIVEIPYDPFAHRWLQLVFDEEATLLMWETSADAKRWDRVAESKVELGFEIPYATIDVGAGVWGGPSSVDPLAVFGHAFVCVP